MRAVVDDERRHRVDSCGSRGSGPAGHGGWSAGRKGRQRDIYSIAESDLERLNDGRVITVRPNGWLRGQLAQLKAVRGHLNRALDR